MLRPDHMLLHGEPGQGSLRPRAQITQWLVLFVEFAVAVTIGLSVAGPEHIAGAIFVAFVSTANCAYLWQPSVYGRRRRMWWIRRAGLTGFALWCFGAFVGVHVEDAGGTWAASWHSTWLFWVATWGLYLVAWGFIRTVIVEAVD